MKFTQRFKAISPPKDDEEQKMKRGKDHLRSYIDLHYFKIVGCKNMDLDSNVKMAAYSVFNFEC